MEKNGWEGVMGRRQRIGGTKGRREWMGGRDGWKR